MKKALNAWSVSAGTGWEEMFAQLHSAGFDGVELNVDGAENASAHSLTLDTNAATLAHIRALSERHAVPVVSISSSLWGSCMGGDSPQERAAAEALLRKQLDCARALGADGILAVPGGNGERSLAAAYRNCEATLRALTPLIEEKGIFVGLENVWNGFFLSPWDMTRLIDALGCPLIGAYYDVGNVVAFSRSADWIEVLGARIGKVHVKDFKRHKGLHSGGAWVDIAKGDTNYAAVLPALRAAGYDGYLTAEVSKTTPNQSDMDFYTEVAATLAGLLERE